MNPQDGIRNTIARYMHAIDDKDIEKATLTFAQNGKLHARGEPATGHAAIRDFLHALWDGSPPDRKTKHMHTASVITVNGNTATSVSDVTVLSCSAGISWAIRATNRHHDKLVLENGEWRFAEKQVKEVVSFSLRSFKSPPAG
jgi:hypothetical protein